MPPCGQVSLGHWSSRESQLPAQPVLLAFLPALPPPAPQKDLLLFSYITKRNTWGATREVTGKGESKGLLSLLSDSKLLEKK